MPTSIVVLWPRVLILVAVLASNSCNYSKLLTSNWRPIKIRGVSGGHTFWLFVVSAHGSMQLLFVYLLL